MKISVRYFARLREALGPGEDIDLAEGGEGVRTVADLRAWLAQRSPAHGALLGPAQPVRAAHDQAMCDGDQPLRAGAEVAFFPPVTGG